MCVLLIGRWVAARACVGVCDVCFGCPDYSPRATAEMVNRARKRNN